MDDSKDGSEITWSESMENDYELDIDCEPNHDHPLGMNTVNWNNSHDADGHLNQYPFLRDEAHDNFENAVGVREFTMSAPESPLSSTSTMIQISRDFEQVTNLRAAMMMHENESISSDKFPKHDMTPMNPMNQMQPINPRMTSKTDQMTQTETNMNSNHFQRMIFSKGI